MPELSCHVAAEWVFIGFAPEVGNVDRLTLEVSLSAHRGAVGRPGRQGRVDRTVMRNNLKQPVLHEDDRGVLCGAVPSRVPSDDIEYWLRVGG